MLHVYVCARKGYVYVCVHIQEGSKYKSFWNLNIFISFTQQKYVKQIELTEAFK